MESKYLLPLSTELFLLVIAKGHLRHIFDNPNVFFFCFDDIDGNLVRLNETRNHHQASRLLFLQYLWWTRTNCQDNILWGRGKSQKWVFSECSSNYERFSRDLEGSCVSKSAEVFLQVIRILTMSWHAIEWALARINAFLFKKKRSRHQRYASLISLRVQAMLSSRTKFAIKSCFYGRGEWRKEKRAYPRPPVNIWRKNPWRNPLIVRGKETG